MQESDVSSKEPEELHGIWRWLAGVIAVLVTLSIVGALVYHRRSLPSADGSPVGAATVTRVDFNCRLPLLASAAGAFISFPGGGITIDHRVKTDFYKGGYGYSYDAQVGRWVPVPPSALSPDGRSYAYLAQTTGVPGESTSMSLHTREIVSGTDRVLWKGAATPTGPSSLAWLPGGIYFPMVPFLADGAEGPGFPAIYVADPNHPGSPRRVGPNPAPQPPGPAQPYYSGPDAFTLIGGGAAWATGNRVPKEAPSPNKPPDPGTYGPDRVLRMDLHDGSVETWYAVPGSQLVSLMGLDSQGRPILAMFEAGTLKSGLGPPPANLLLLTGPNQTVSITSGNTDFHMGAAPFADSHGVWFGSWDSLWLYSQSGGFRQVAAFAPGTFPSPTPPPGFPGKGFASDARSEMPAYAQGTLVIPAGACT